MIEADSDTGAHNTCENDDRNRLCSVTYDLHIYHCIEYLLTKLPKLKEFASEEEEAEAMERLHPCSAELREYVTNGER